MSTPIGGATRGLWIEPSEVHKAAAAARKVAHDIPEDVKALFTPTDTAVAGLVGFQSAQAIDDCLEAWTKALRSLAGMVGGAPGSEYGPKENWFGTDPADDHFGGHHFSVAPGEDTGLTGLVTGDLPAHSIYFDDRKGGDSLNNIAKVVTGHGNEIKTTAPR
ncbi:hypothetical protein OG693_13725 [Streptomyces sp. NBC_01259]|uniref:hypothetical protein n=1 Tax=Streptomyces sp. NBC_01259 TaxID=2903800 RepID=UPI003253D388